MDDCIINSASKFVVVVDPLRRNQMSLTAHSGYQAGVGANELLHHFGLVNFEKPGSSHSTANAHGADYVLHASALSFDQCMADHAGSAHSVRVSN